MNLFVSITLKLPSVRFLGFHFRLIYLTHRDEMAGKAGANEESSAS